MVKFSGLVRIALQVIEFPYIGTEKCLGVVDKSPRSPAKALAPHVLSDGDLPDRSVSTFQQWSEIAAVNGVHRRKTAKTNEGRGDVDVFYKLARYESFLRYFWDGPDHRHAAHGVGADTRRLFCNSVCAAVCAMIGAVDDDRVFALTGALKVID